MGNHIYHSVGDNPAVGTPVRPDEFVHVLQMNPCVIEAVLCFALVWFEDFQGSAEIELHLAYLLANI